MPSSSVSSVSPFMLKSPPRRYPNKRLMPRVPSTSRQFGFFCVVTLLYPLPDHFKLFASFNLLFPYNFEHRKSRHPTAYLRRIPALVKIVLLFRLPYQITCYCFSATRWHRKSRIWHLIWHRKYFDIKSICNFVNKYLLVLLICLIISP